MKKISFLFLCIPFVFASCASLESRYYDAQAVCDRAYYNTPRDKTTDTKALQARMIECKAILTNASANNSMAKGIWASVITSWSIFGLSFILGFLSGAKKR